MVDTRAESPDSPAPPRRSRARPPPRRHPPMSAPDSGLIAAVILAGGVTALVAIGMMVVRQYRAAQLTAGRGALSVTLGLGIMALAGLGIVALSPVAAQ